MANLVNFSGSYIFQAWKMTTVTVTHFVPTVALYSSTLAVTSWHG